ncbi:hypothetical protein [Sinorhizobium fredii]|uniref:Uncharacterized protein n=1 Tax=Rhizobium fredii TaxID=380 RepID=A0A844A8F5_RHIFR|nr:hypothetical protein [Sinorhizobium fredii]MQX09233.1 hypothetical protein [Sinorhizobium fredii]GEC30677.1 hypothetical protein EFR01_08480 [Sinorhizobium fredii]GLS06612.1 hypothetical protein GCM10007864_02370 [Sinorhizobium fredii]
MKIEVHAINVLRNVSWDRHFAILAFGDIALPEIQTTIRGCALAKNGKDFIALPPKTTNSKDTAAVQWNIRGDFAWAVRDALMDAYKRMGGEEPPPLTESQQNGINAARRYAEKTKAGSADNDNDDSGVLRTIRIEHEEAERACG